jgi:lipopolysaccharide/colanic/teichoic acid biosynthesis glycosyltransferase
MNWYMTWGKRTFDIVVSLTGLFACLPLFFVVAVCIKIESRGSVFFIQKRMGRLGILFSLIKFRTMRADPKKERLLFEPGKQNRVTRTGRLLRKTKIDELPQLINVIRGDMSIVGPRPEVEKYRHFYSGNRSLVLSVNPGITDPASLKYRNEEELLRKSNNPDGLYSKVILQDKLAINFEYIQHGFRLKDDLRIIISTIFAIITDN